MTTGQICFAAFGLTSQAVLVAFFAARRWWPRRAGVLGSAAYALGALGMPLAILLVLDGQTGTLFIGPLLIAVWAFFGAIVDVWRPRPWRGPPIEWKVLAAYFAVYFFAQMFMWWPLWTVAREVWVVFLVLFVANTALNVQGHARPGSHIALRGQANCPSRWRRLRGPRRDAALAERRGTWASGVRRSGLLSLDPGASSG